MDVGTMPGSSNSVATDPSLANYGPFFGEHALLPVAYYEHAIHHMLNQDRHSTFFVFSDDAPYAKEWLRGDARFVVVDHNNEAAAHEDLRLMSLCRHHIIANRTLLDANLPRRLMQVAAA